MSHIKRRVVAILKDDYMPIDEKVDLLRQMEADSLSKERSATEGMAASGDDGEDGEELKAIEMALRKLGQEPAEAGAATL